MRHQVIQNKKLATTLKGWRSEAVLAKTLTIESPNSHKPEQSHIPKQSHSFWPHENVTIWVREGFQKKNQSEFFQSLSQSFIIFEKFCNTGLNLKLFGQFSLQVPKQSQSTLTVTHTQIGLTKMCLFGDSTVLLFRCERNLI